MSKPRISGDRCLRKVEPPPITPSEEIEVRQYGAWQEWLRGLTPDEIVAMENMEDGGLKAPEPPRRRKRARRATEEDEQTEGTCDDLSGDDLDPSEVADQLDPSEVLMAKEEAAWGKGTSAARFAIDDTTKRDLQMLGYVLPHIVDAENPRLEAEIVALALRIGARQGITAAGLAKKHGRALVAVEEAVGAWHLKFAVCSFALGLLKLVMSPILASRNPRLEAETAAIAARMGLTQGASMTARGEHHGVVRAAISSRVRRWGRSMCIELPLPRECKKQTSNYVLFNKRREKTKGFDE